MDLKPWQCRNNHVLGIYRLNGNRTPRLMLYRHAVDAASEHPAEVDLMIGPVVGQIAVRCDICDDVKLWDVSVDDVEELIRGLEHEEKIQLQAQLSQERSKPLRKSRAVFE